MLIPDQVQVFLCTEPVDMRNGYNGLAGIVRDAIKEEPVSGKVFVFRSKRGDNVKVFYWHHNGYAIWSKRLQSGSFKFPQSTSEGSVQITRSALRMILEGITLSSLQTKAA